MSTIKSLLGLKKWKEDETKNRFAALLKELAHEERLLADMEDRFKGIGKRLDYGTDEMVNIDEVKSLNEYLGQLLSRINKQKETIAAKERQVEEARNALVDATKERKVFERLDEKRQAVLEKEFRRKEQIGIDEHAITGHTRKKEER
ncbi:MAG TPA: flagellar export protein FliJ [Dissulfurispiraceae bacterium]